VVHINASCSSSGPETHAPRARTDTRATPAADDTTMRRPPPQGNRHGNTGCGLAGDGPMRRHGRQPRARVLVVCVGGMRSLRARVLIGTVGLDPALHPRNVGEDHRSPAPRREDSGIGAALAAAHVHPTP
jgi:hypothetical protein